jgi:hypothetical protein
MLHADNGLKMWLGGEKILSRKKNKKEKKIYINRYSSSHLADLHK